MRPVTRGDQPVGATNYEQMREELKSRWGTYCSYCEIRFQPAHAEHIIPQDLFPAYRDDWDNLLVSCSYCNGRKGRERPTPETRDNYLWPTTDNTARAFSYANIIPEVADGLTHEQQVMAALLRGLLNLAVTKDDRHKSRVEAFNLAPKFAAKLASSPDPDLCRDAIVHLAKLTGFFSVWMEVFAGDLEIRRRLIAEFPGTTKECFDPSTTKPIARSGGRV